MRLLLLNIRTDAEHTALGFTTSWINELARHCETIDVITMHAGVVAVAPNVRVHSVGRERGWSEPRRALAFYRLSEALTRGGRIDACFAHMTPLFAAMLAPLARLRGFPILLWYAHGNVTWQLRAAERVVDRCVTSTPSGFRLPSRKLRVLSQGIDTARFRPPENPAPDHDRTILSIGRLTRRKHVDEVIEALARLRRSGEDLRLLLVGDAVAEADRAYADELRAAVAAHGLDGAVTFAGAVPYTEIAAQYHRAGVFANVSATGSLDKAILEAMAAGCIPVSRNESFAALAAAHGLEALVPGPGAEGLAAALARVGALPDGERAALRERCRTLVEQEHSLRRLMERVYAELAELAEARRARRTRS